MRRGGTLLHEAVGDPNEVRKLLRQPPNLPARRRRLAIAEAALGATPIDLRAAPKVADGRSPVLLQSGERGYVGERGGHLRVVGSQRLLADGEAALEEGRGVIITASRF